MPSELPPIVVTARFLPTEFDSDGGSGGSVGSSEPGIFRDYDALEDNPKAADGTPVASPGDTSPILNDNGFLTESEKTVFRAAVAYLFNKIANTPLTPANQNTTTPLGLLEASEVYNRFMNYDMRITTGVSYGPNSAGAVVGGKGQAGATAIDLNGYKGYQAWPRGLEYLILHEVVHTTEIATNRLDSVYRNWRASASDKSDNAWKNSEPSSKTSAM